MTDNEKTKALQCCIEGDCDNCPYDEQTACNEYMKQDCLDLINRRELKIKGLRRLLYSFLDTRNGDLVRITDNELEIIKKPIKAEAYKEFWNSRPERLNEKCKDREEYNKGWNACLDEFWEIRNNLLKEMEGEDK